MQHKVIYDVIHGNIELSKLETLLLKNPIVNRLNQILQNSTAYTVYPNIKTTRFEHSLGTMDYAGKMFQNGLINSDIAEIYLEEKKEILKELIRFNHEKLFNSLPKGGAVKLKYNRILFNEFSLNREVKDFENILDNEKFENYLNSLIGNDFIKRNIFNPLHNDGQAIKYSSTNILLYETIRFFGMLHDIGHLPLSHLFEFSIDNVFEYLESKNSLTKIEKKYQETINNLLNVRGETEKDQLHEIIGKNITKFIFVDIKNNIYNDYNLRDKQKAIYIFIIFVIEQIWEEIIKGKKGKFDSLYGIISNTIDADRLDFVQRDGIMSGIAKSIGNIDRILAMYCLGRKPIIQPDNKDQYLFMPAIQSLNDIEELLNHRFRIYKYVVNHHAVKRSDYIFQKIIELKIIDDLKNEKKSEDLTANSLLRAIDIADDIIKDENKSIYREIIYKFVQITDYWLLSLFNKEFNSSIEKAENEETTYDILLKEVYENRRNIKSLWKRDHEFQDFLFEFAMEISNNWNSSIKEEDYSLDSIDETNKLFKKSLQLLVTCKKDQSEYYRLLKINNENIDQINGGLLQQKEKGERIQEIMINQEKIDKIKGKFISLGIKIIHLLNILSKEFPWIKELENFLSNEEELPSIILISPPKLSNGIKNLLLIDNKNQDNSLMSFDKFSNLKNSIDSEISRSIKFFVYYLENSKKDDEIMEIIRKKITSFLIGYFEYIVKNKFLIKN